MKNYVPLKPSVYTVADYFNPLWGYSSEAAVVMRFLHVNKSQSNYYFLYYINMDVIRLIMFIIVG